MQKGRLISLFMAFMAIAVLMGPGGLFTNIEGQPRGHSEILSSENKPRQTPPRINAPSITVLRDPITITDNSNFTSENGVISGNGTEEDPYIMTGFAISGLEHEWAISISDTDKYVVIRDIIIANIQNGIHLTYADNVKIENCLITEIHGRDGLDATNETEALGGLPAYGIRALAGENLILRNLNLTNIFGGNGGDGITSSTIPRLYGKSGGSAHGISYDGARIEDVVIEDCIVDHVQGGTGGNGADGLDAVGALESGDIGGMGGFGGSAIGINTRECKAVVKDNIVRHIFAGGGGSGGDGGDSGTAAGDPGDGGEGRDSGTVSGIQCSLCPEIQVVNNQIFDLHKARGGDGGNAGHILNGGSTFISDGCEGGNSDSLYGIYIYTIDQGSIVDNEVSFLYANASGLGGYNRTEWIPAGENEPLNALFLTLESTGLRITRNIMRDFIIGSFEVESYALNLQFLGENNSAWLNHFGGPINVNASEGFVMNTPLVGNYWATNIYSSDISPTDGICDDPFIVSLESGISDYAPLAYGLIGDEDSDGLSNIDEYGLGACPSCPDTDGDSLPDGWEVDHGFDPKSGFEAGLDHDLDGLNLALEYYYGTDFLSPDTDGDGFGDGVEVGAWTDPLDPTDYPVSIVDDNGNSTADNVNSDDDRPSDDDTNSDAGSGGGSIPGYPALIFTALSGILVILLGGVVPKNSRKRPPKR